MNKIGELRRLKKLTQAGLAELVGTSANTIARYERGEMEPSFKNAHKIAEVLGCTEAELLSGANDGKIKITLSYDWSKYEKGEIDMTGNAFELNLGRFGTVELQGAGDFKSLQDLQDIDDFLARAREQLVIALEAQQKRGAIQLA